jgi:hypothetical protein
MNDPIIANERIAQDLERFHPHARRFYQPLRDIVTRRYFAMRCRVCGSYILYMGEEQQHNKRCPGPYAQELMVAEDYRSKILYEQGTAGIRPCKKGEMAWQSSRQ